MADGRDLLSQQPLAPSAVRARLASGRGHAAGPFLVEQFIEREDGSGRLPIEYKCHTFGSHVAAIQRTERAHEGDGGITHRFYRPDWSLFDDPMSTAVPLTRPVAAPPFLEALLETARQLGQAVGTYMRVDMFGSCAGIVFNEFSSMPALRHPKFTPHCRELFGAMWDDTFPDAV